MTSLEPLQAIFKNRSFVIPDYQRGYAWEDSQREDLLNDLEDLEQMDESKAHFTGTLVIHKGKHSSQIVSGSRIDIVDIVDGQQRITSLIIMLDCIVKALSVFNDPLADETSLALKNEYIKRDSIQGTLYRLKLNGGSNTFFKDHILGDNPVADINVQTDRNLLAAKTQFKNYLSTKLGSLQSGEDQCRFLYGLADRITNRLGFVLYEVDTEAEVGVMFEVMNARGRPLTQLEKVKNFLLYLSGRVSRDTNSLQGITDEVNNTWKTLLESIADAGLQADEDQFLRYHWAIYPGAKWFQDNKRARTFDIHRAVKETLNLRQSTSPNELYAGIVEYLASARSLVISYRDILHPNHPQSFSNTGSARQSLVDQAQKLRRIGRLATVLPILMAAHNRYMKEPSSLLELFRLAEIFIFRLAALEKNANTGDSYAYETAARIMKGLSASKAIDDFKGLIDYYCTASQLKSALSNAERDFYTWPTLRYFLYEYERYLTAGAKQGFTIDWEAISKRSKDDTVEHILPQGDNTLDVPYWSERFSRESFLRCRNLLGNLCLTDWNSYYSNKPFDDKKGSLGASLSEKVYHNSRWRMERELCEYLEWTPVSIDDRQIHMVEFATQRWSFVSVALSERLSAAQEIAASILAEIDE